MEECKELRILNLLKTLDELEIKTIKEKDIIVQELCIKFNILYSDLVSSEKGNKFYGCA